MDQLAWFDAGVNLLDARFDAIQVIEQARAAGVAKLCVITTCAKQWDAAASLQALYPDTIVYTLGVHPHYAKDANSADWAYLSSLLDEPGVVAIGECGLDFNRNFSPPNVQIDVFLHQLEIAKQSNKALYLHQRDAFEQQIHCLKQVFQAHALNGIAHCFTGSTEQMQGYLDLGLYIGITGWLCDPKRGADLRESIKYLPNDKLIFETDAPYLFPKHVRPRKSNNSPEYIAHIAQYYAEITQQSLSNLQQISYNNSMKLFNV